MNWELIFVDDGSNPPITMPPWEEGYERPQRRIMYTNDTRPWTQGLARNRAADAAKGSWLLMTDVDHVFTSEAIEEAERFSATPYYATVLHFRRVCGLLQEDLSLRPLPELPCVPGVHGNTFLIRAEDFKTVKYRPKPGHDWGAGYWGEDADFMTRLTGNNRFFRAEFGSATTYVIPNTHAQFHTLNRTW